MLTIFSITLPIFLLIGLGYLSVKTHMVKPEAIPSLGSLILYFIVPATVFSAISRIHFSEVIEPEFIPVYALASLLTVSVGLVVSRKVLKQDMGGSAIRALGMSMPNSIFIGYPILLLSLTDTATVAFMLAILVENLLIMPILLILLEYSAGKNQSNGQNVWKTVGLRILKNPLILPIVAGTIASLVWLLPPFDPALQKSVIIIAAVPMLTIYPILGDRFGYRGFCANALLLTTVAAFFSLAAVLWMVGV